MPQYFECISCGLYKDIEYLYEEECRVCSKCAEKISNVYNMQHSGEWLTWQNEKPNQIKQKIPQKLRWEVFERDDFRCKLCGSRKELCADHIFPESLGGLATICNLQTLCKKCNSKKKDKYVYPS